MSAAFPLEKNLTVKKVIHPDSHAAPQKLTHIMSVDVEDYFQVEAFAKVVSRDTWDSWPSRVVNNTRRVLELFDEYNVKATFFFVGWVARKFPILVREASARGHEIACHSYWHRAIYKLSPQEFREDTRMAKDVLEQICGRPVQGYRAPTWSITRQCLWALDILAEQGFTYDSSIYPIHHDLYGVPGAQRLPYTITLTDGAQLREFPPATVSVFGCTLPAAGGGYLRIMPAAFTELAFRQAEQIRTPLTVYFHPWEIDPEQPRIAAGWKSRFRHYTRLSSMEKNLQRMLARRSFGSYVDRLRKESGSCNSGTMNRDLPGLSLCNHPDAGSPAIICH